MTPRQDEPQRPRAGATEIWWFLAITFGITWTMGAAAFAFPDWVVATFGPLDGSSPYFYVAVWAPNVAAVALTAMRGGWPAMRKLLARLVRWRAPLWVWIAALTFYPALMLIVQAIGLIDGRPMAGFELGAAVAIGIFSLPALALGPLGEEVGWRGYLLPRVLDRFNATGAALVVGAIWMVWHMPAFFISGLPQEDMALPIFMVSGVALSMYVTWIFVNARQSILIAGIIPHAIVNACGQAMGAMTWAQAGVLVAGAVLLVVAFGAGLRPRRDDAVPVT